MAVDHDLIAVEVHRKALENLTNEMAITLLRTSGSPIVVEAKDFSTCLMDTKPEHLGFAAYVLFHFGSSLAGTEVIVDTVKDGDVRPGDGWIINDPHTGGAMHQGDVAIIMPTFYGDELMGWSFTNMHVLDIGGVGISGYAPGAHDVYQEGMLFPPVRIIRDGAIDSEWERFISINTRTPGPVLNDLRSMIAANNTAASKLSEIIDEFGVERHREYCEISKDLTEKLLRERISRIPDGVYETVDWNEFDGHDGPDMLLETRCKLEVEGEDLNFTFSGVPQIDAFVNAPRGAMMGSIVTPLLTTLAYGDLPVNGGIWRPLNFDFGEPGSIVNATPPAPVSNAHCEVGMRVTKMTKDVISQALSLSDDPELRSRVAGQCQESTPNCALIGENQHGGTSVLFYMDVASGIGGGAQTIGDGQDAYGFTCMTGCGIPDVETHEAADPVIFLWRGIVENSGGPGQHRGGQALGQAYAFHYSDSVGGPGFNACAEVPPRGFGGGYPGSAGNFFPMRETNVGAMLEAGTVPRKEELQGTAEPVCAKVPHITFARDDVFVTTCGGGGGLGDPLLRDPEVVVGDVAARYITAGHALAGYGVVIDGDGGLDVEATAARREEIRRERIGAEPVRPLEAPDSIGVSLVLGESGDVRSWQCGHCGQSLAAAEEDWADGAVVREVPIAERYAELEMTVRDREEEPRVMLREHFCPSCAAGLAIQVVTEGLEPLRAARLADPRESELVK
jgi:N-methylhydantoinase B